MHVIMIALELLIICRKHQMLLLLRKTGRLKKLLDFQQNGRPLVINFGSCTWPPFVAKLDQFRSLIGRFGNVADFIVVYIEEAHPSNGWKFGDNFDISDHRFIYDRLAAAKVMQELVPECDVVVDTMKNTANLYYGAYYERLYVVLDNVIVYAGERGPQGYRMGELETWLEKYTS